MDDIIMNRSLWSMRSFAVKSLVAVMFIVVLAGDVLAAGVVDTQPDHHAHVGERIANSLRRLGWPDELVVVAISTLPIVELRGAIPVGHMMGMNPWLIYVLAVAGNMIPIPFILLLLGPVSKYLMRFKLGKIFFDWLFARTRRKTVNIEKYESLGLTIFVAIPLPVTGGWTGSMAAFLMDIKFHHAMLCILMGVMIAGIVMTVLSLLGWIGAIIAGLVLIGLAVSAILGIFKREEGNSY